MKKVALFSVVAATMLLNTYADEIKPEVKIKTEKTRAPEVPKSTVKTEVKHVIAAKAAKSETSAVPENPKKLLAGDCVIPAKPATAATPSSGKVKPVIPATPATPASGKVKPVIPAKPATPPLPAAGACDTPEKPVSPTTTPASK